MKTAWRLVPKKRADSAFDGAGAGENGGRFNSQGTAVVYTSDTYALALLEVAVHVLTYRMLRDRVAFEVTFDDDLVEVFDPEDLPNDWDSRPTARATQLIGDEWVESKRSAVLQVPSVVAPHHFNFILNPAHSDFRLITIGIPFQHTSTLGSSKRLE